MDTNIKIAKTDSEILGCFEVMKELRPQLVVGNFIARIRQQEGEGYQLCYLVEENKPLAVAGFRLGHNLAWGRFLYVDDLVTLASYRSRGYGSKLLAWLLEYAVKENCDQFHLDSGVWRAEAHRFYEREGMELSSYHFRKILQSST
ncbi:MAG: GNAT family N-acetyltransferase [bacterium]|nr:MAG: GNAT family N-acetyltransferase [bacterium]